MGEQIRKINPKDYGVDLHSSPSGRGIDSDVFLGYRDALHVYAKDRVDYSTLSKYLRLNQTVVSRYTNAVKEEIQIIINPITEIGVIDGPQRNGYCVSISPIVYGTVISDEIATANSAVVGSFWRKFLSELTLEINKTTGVSLVKLDALNVMYRDNTLTIVDLCANVSNLKRAKI